MHCFQFLSTLIVAFDLASAAPAKSEWELASLFPRKTGDFCNALEGNGSCQATSDCKGISYPTGLCPDDPADVQVYALERSHFLECESGSYKNSAALS